ncbi:hypothetical protein D046_7081 [Vibrio parahaemolyticus V-223/04]|nr:hypothetical protein D046_7081 [Vibrio parahaemolyticus V-223/04]
MIHASLTTTDLFPKPMFLAATTSHDVYLNSTCPRLAEDE